MICPLMMSVALLKPDKDFSKDHAVMECQMEKCAWWVTYRAPYNIQECALKHLADSLHQQMMPSSAPRTL